MTGPAQASGGGSDHDLQHQYALVAVYDVAWLSGPRDDVLDHLTNAARDAAASYTRRNVAGTDTLFLSATSEPPRGPYMLAAVFEVSFLNRPRDDVIEHFEQAAHEAAETYRRRNVGGTSVRFLAVCRGG